jgi:hypothetical protein
MKQTIYILTFALGQLSCSNQATNKYDVVTNIDSLQKVGSADKQKQDIYIKDKSQYDQTFIDGLSEYNEPIKLIDNYILVGKDTTYFPEDLIVNKATTFKATKDNNKFVLTVTRTNLTNLIYNFQLTDKDNKSVITKSGNAILGSTFFLGPEGDNDIEGSYGSQEYRDNGNDSWLSIRIEIGKAVEGKQRAKIQYDFSDKTKQSLDLDECPTLRIE